MRMRCVQDDKTRVRINPSPYQKGEALLGVVVPSSQQRDLLMLGFHRAGSKVVVRLESDRSSGAIGLVGCAAILYGAFRSP